jgi:hypothetical protein
VWSLGKIDRPAPASSGMKAALLSGRSKAPLGSTRTALGELEAAF